MDKDRIIQCFEYLSTESKEHDFVRELDEPPTTVEFLRDWVLPNQPVIIRQGIKHWPAMERWSNWDYLKNKIGSTEVTVAVTPNGFADAIYQNKFVMPHEEKMRMSKFIDILRGAVSFNGVPYIQKQNSNLTEEFSELRSDMEENIPWAAEAFGNRLDAVNIWMGDHRAVTSIHKDHYENIYCVVSGSKDFILYRPTDQPWIPYEEFPSAIYKMSKNGDFTIDDLQDEPKTPWINFDPLRPDLDRYPLLRNATPIHCRVEAGDMLYLPSLWFHHVRQSHGCIAVNYWYDMNFDIKYNYFKFIEMIISKMR